MAKSSRQRWLSITTALTPKADVNLPWLTDIIARKPAKVVAVAQANKTARIVWALLRHGGTYQRPETVPAA